MSQRNMHRKAALVTLAAILMLAALPLAAQEAPALEDGFLTAALAAAPHKAFDVGGDWTVGGFLGVGTDGPARAVHLQGRNAVFRMDRDVNSAAFLLVRTAVNDFDSIWKTFSLGANADAQGDGSFIINDLGASVSGGGARRLTIDNDGNFGLNTSTPLSALQVHGTGTSILLSLLDGNTIRLLADSDGDLSIEGDFSLSGDAALNQRIRVPEEDGGSLAGLLIVEATSSGLWHVSDSNDDSPEGFFTHMWFDGGTESTDTQMALGQGPDATLFVDGAVQQNSAFDLAEAFWKGDAAIEAGHVVRIDPNAPHAVALADREADPTVVGVVSTAPGFILGGGAFSTEQLARVWGADIAAVFEEERANLELEAYEGFEALRELERDLTSFETFRAKHLAAGASETMVEKLRLQYSEQRQRLANELERIELSLFFEKHFIRLALAGRVPVLVDASYGAVEAGDLLVASPTPGHAMRAENPEPGTIVGKALQPLARGTDRISMMVMLR